MNLDRLFELAGINLLYEAAYDGMVDSIKRQFPNNIKEIDDNLKWAKDNLTKQDRIVWYLKVLKAFLSNNINIVKGNYNFQSLEKFNNDLIHYYGYNINQIDSTQLANQNISELFQLFDSYITKYQESDKAPVPVKHGDYELIKCNDGNSWWFINRSYCAEEGRSGKHCGNVVGKHDTTQRILSLRTPNHNVILTFILLDNGYLGEMKAKANLKPQEKYHQDIMQLLLNPIVKGIKGAGYAPYMNFSIFDLSEQNIKILINHNKQSFIIHQIVSEPIEFLKAPNYIKDNPEYQQVAIKCLPALKHLIGNENNLDAWEQAIREKESLIIFAPQELDNFQNRVISYLKHYPEDLLKSPKYISNNFEINAAIVEDDGANIQYIMPTVPKYDELCKISISYDGTYLSYIPEEHRTPELCKLSVSQHGWTLEYVPEPLRTFELCKLAVSTEGFSLQFIPEKLKTVELCNIAVSKNGYAIQFVPFNNLSTNEIDRLCKVAVTNKGWALEYVPEEFKTYDICKMAVYHQVYSIKFVPDKFKDKIKQELNIQESVNFKYFQNL